MSAKPPPVPSKNALRALRQLAFSTPTIFVTALGGACAIATLNYDARRKVKVAEQIIATKRTIRSIANGRGSAHVRCMFEAAERGEDFTLDPSNSSKRRRLRNYSALAVEKGWNEEAEIERLQTVLKHSGSRNTTHRDGHPNHREGETAESSSADRSKVVRIRNQQSGTYHWTQPKKSTSRPIRVVESFVLRYQKGEVRNTLPHGSAARSSTELKGRQPPAGQVRTESIKAASQMPLKSPNYAVYDRPKSKVSEKDSLATLTEVSPVDNLSTDTGNHQNPIDIAEEKGASPTETHHQIGPPQSHAIPGTDDLTGNFGGGATANVSTGLPNDKPSTSDHQAEVQSEQFDFPIHVTPIYTSSDPYRWVSILKGRKKLQDWSETSEQILERAVKTDTTSPGSAPSTSHQGEEPSLDSKDDVMNYFRRHHEQFQRSTNTSQNKSWRVEPHLQSDKREKEEDPALTDVTSEDVSHGTSHGPISPHEIRPVASEQVASEMTEADVYYIGADSERSANVSQLALGSKKDPATLWKRADQIIQQIQRLPPDMQIDKWLEHVEICTKRNDRSEGRLGQMLQYRFYEIVGRERWSKMGVELVHGYLSSATHRDQADSILFPTQSRVRDNYTRSQKYLESFCAFQLDPTKQSDEAEKVIQAAVRRQLPLTEAVYLPVLKSLCSMGRAHEAEAFAIHVVDEYGIIPGYETRYHLANALASLGDWHAVNLYMWKWHVPAYSRKRAFAFGRLFRAIFEHYLNQRSINEAFDYLVHALNHWGLMPTEHITAIFVPACVRNGRFDLIESWIQITHELYQRMDMGPTFPDTISRVADVWFQQQMSCEDIERTCHALARAAVSDPFPASMRDIAMQGMKEDLQRRLSSDPAARRFCQKHNVEPESTNFDKLVGCCMAILQDQRQRPRHFHTLLGRQIDAIARLGALFGGQPAQARFESTPVSTRSRKSSPKAMADPGDDITNSIILPHRANLWKLVARHYAKQQSNGVTITHELLEAVVLRLGREQRFDEAHDLLNSVYESSYVHGLYGTAFGASTLSSWLRIALELKSQGAVETALFASLECARSTEVSTRFRVLFEMVVERLSGSGFIHNVLPVPEAKEEAQYLKSRLAECQWRQEGLLDEKHKDQFPNWRPWWERFALDQRGYGDKFTMPEVLQQVGVA